MARQETTNWRSRRSRRLIVDALMVLMREKRYDWITVQEIIDRADVGRSTFCAQFRNKEDVLVSEIERVLGLLHEQQVAAAKDPADLLLPGAEFFRHVQNDPLVLSSPPARAGDRSALPGGAPLPARPDSAATRPRRRLPLAA